MLLPSDEPVASDIYIIGTEESTPSKLDWEILVQKTLGPSYVLVQTAVYGVLYLLFFIRRDLIWFCSGKILVCIYVCMYGQLMML